MNEPWHLIAEAQESRQSDSSFPVPRSAFRVSAAALLLIAWLSSSGCARMSQTLSTTLTHTNGTVEIRSSKAAGWAFWDAKQTLEKLRVSNGKTHSIGLTGAEQETSSTNAAATLDAVGRLLQSIPR